MNYTIKLLRSTKIISLLSSIVIWALYVYFKLSEFIKAVILLKYIRVQTIAFILYSVLLVLLPVANLFLPMHIRKQFFRWACNAISAVILIGAIGDLVTYKFFIDYIFHIGDAIFCNIVVSIPNIYGTICCLVLSLAYFLLGKNAKSRSVSLLLYLLIFIIGVASPLLYSLTSWGGYPRQAWLEKAAFIIPHQACMLISFAMSFFSELLWDSYMQQFS